MFSSRVLAAAQAAGAALKIAPAVSDFARHLTEECRLVLVDLTMPGLVLGDVVATARSTAPQARIVAFGPHVDEAALAAARAAGCDVLTRGQFNASYAALLQSAV